MFQFPEFAACGYVFTTSSRLNVSGVSPFGDPRIICLLAAPRGLSQLSTSFIASDCLGIHHTPFVA